ncbi:hypothetical protein GCM10007094_32870 [Pseudovibrio japonicus]|uniref:Dipeptidase n=2 Tax=Pseudovibrio japonicus TaxID=366534 RepID=A0ABQ3EIK9_9HYPH|nr:hypothetical protein GCM10007094_32870 [Pseudovibrio japonicus]
MNGGLNEFGVAVRNIWSPSRPELVALTPKDQSGPNYSDFARLVIERATTAREGVDLIAKLIAQYGECSYGGNSHIIADTNEAWVMVQFSGGQGLWAAERLGPDSVRASRPGYICEIPIDEPDHPDFLYSDNLVSFAKTKGWYTDGVFDANAVYGDGKGRWAGVQWIEGQMAERAQTGQKIGLNDMIWALRTSKLTGDKAGYGQIVPLMEPAHNDLRMLWHAPIGAIAAPFSPVFMGQTGVPPEFGKHRYLTAGEAHCFLDDRKIDETELNAPSSTSQWNETSRSAVADCKRLLYLMLQDTERFTREVTEAFENHEARVAAQAVEMLRTTEILIDQGEATLATSLCTYFSSQELLAGLGLVQALCTSLEPRARIFGRSDRLDELKKYDQIW